MIHSASHEEFEAQLATAHQTAERCAALIAYARHMLNDHSQRAIQLGEAVDDLLDQVADEDLSHYRLAAGAIRVQGLYQIGDLVAALELGRTLLATYGDLPTTIDLIYLISRLTWVYADIGRFERALELNRHAMRLAEQAARADWRLLVLSDRSVIHDRMGERADVYRVMLAVSEDPALANLAAEDQALLSYNIAIAYATVEQHDAVLLWVERGLAAQRTGFLLTLRASTLAALEHHHEADAAFAEALALVEQTGDFFDRFSVHHNRARLLAKRGELDAAIATVQHALIIAQDAPTLQINAWASLAEFYAQRGDYTQAFHSLQEVDHLRQEIFNIDRDRRIRALELEFQAELARREAERERQRHQELQRHIAELKQLQAELRELSLRDTLTGVYNRRYLTEQGSLLIYQAYEEGLPLCIGMFDIDHFKQINDRYSHQAGDRVLRQVAALARACLQIEDQVVRYGGEEFALIMPLTALSTAIERAELLRTTIAAYQWEQIGSGIAVTISIGLVQLRDDPELELLFQAADRQLYRAKHAGRNCICYEEPTP